MQQDQAVCLPYSGKDVPHVVIEVNQTCNITCKACYKDKTGYTKPLEQIKREIDIAVSQRNLSLMTLAGGEPTLHPELPEVIRYGASKGVQVQMLTNGYVLEDEQLGEYKRAGLFGAFLHIDSLQKRADANGATSEKALNPLRKRLAEKIVRSGLYCFLECTLYQDNLAELPDIIQFVLDTKEVSRLLVTCCTDGGTAARGLRGGTILGTHASVMAPELVQQKKLPTIDPEAARQVVRNAEVKKLLWDTMGMVPFGYIASSKRSSEQRWLMYYAFAITLPTGETKVFHVPASFGKLVELSYRVEKRRGKPYTFGSIVEGRKAAQICLYAALSSKSPRIIGEAMAFLSNLARPGARIYQKSLNIQEGPSITDAGELEYCRDCPDATVRDGMLVPVCMVDYLRPMA